MNEGEEGEQKSREINTDNTAGQYTGILKASD